MSVESFEDEVLSWPARTAELCTRHLMTRIYSVSHIKQPQFNRHGAVVDYSVTFRDLGVDFDLRFTASLAYVNRSDCRVRVQNLDVTGSVYTTHVNTPSKLAEAVFGPFNAERQALEDHYMRDFNM